MSLAQDGVALPLLIGWDREREPIKNDACSGTVHCMTESVGCSLHRDASRRSLVSIVLACSNTFCSGPRSARAQWDRLVATAPLPPPPTYTLCPLQTLPPWPLARPQPAPTLALRAPTSRTATCRPQGARWEGGEGGYGPCADPRSDMASVVLPKGPTPSVVTYILPRQFEGCTLF